MGWGGEGHMHSKQVLGVDPWSLPIENEDNHSSLR